VKVELDEDLPRRAAPLLAAGHDVDSVHDEGLAGADDPNVSEVATAAGRLVITLDRGVGDIQRRAAAGCGGLPPSKISSKRFGGTARHRPTLDGQPRRETPASALTTYVRALRGAAGVSPSALLFAADASSVASFGVEDAGVSSVSVAPAQVAADRASEGGVIGVVAVGDDELA